MSWNHRCSICGKPVLSAESHVAKPARDADGKLIPGESIVAHFTCAYPGMKRWG